MVVDWTWTPASIVTAYAAIVATAALFVSLGSLFWSIHIGRRDSAKIMVTVQGNAYLYPRGNSKPTGPYYGFNIVNKGRRPVTITEYGFRSRMLLMQLNPYPTWENFPFELGEGKSRTLLAIPEKVKEGLRDKYLTPPRKAYARDAVGNFYTCKVPRQVRDDMWGDASYRPWWKFWEQGWWPW